MGPSMQPSPLAVEQKPKYSIFCLGKRMVMALYPAIERVASPIPSRALRANAIPENQSLNALNTKKSLLIINISQEAKSKGSRDN